MSKPLTGLWIFIFGLSATLLLGGCQSPRTTGNAPAAGNAAGSAPTQPTVLAVESFLADMAQRKWLGKKAKLGFYHWNRQHRPNSELKPTALPVQPTGDFETDGLTPTSRRLVYPMLNEAVHCLDELVVSEPWMVDLGMVLGTGFAPMHGGPLRLIDTIGAGVVWRNMCILERSYGKRFSPADGLAARAARQQPF